MKFFKNRTVAILLCVLMVVGSTLLNTRVRFGRLCRAEALTFYDEGSIAPQLTALHDEARALASMAESKGLSASSLLDAAELLRQMLDQYTLDAGEIYPYYRHLNEELKDVEQRLLTVPHSEEEAAALSDSLAHVHNLQTSIAASPYNETVRNFCRQNGRFPTALLAALAGVSYPQEFA